VFALQPANVKAFIDRVINIPLHDIAIPLSGFRWEFNKVNFSKGQPILCFSLASFVFVAYFTYLETGKFPPLEAFIYSF
jgi:hypothetical protein